MLVKILGAIDFIAAVLLLLLIWNLPVFESLLWIFGLLVLIKGIMFAIMRDIGSIMDIYAGIIILLPLSMNISKIFFIVACFLLIQKAIMSFM